MFYCFGQPYDVCLSTRASPFARRDVSNVVDFLAGCWKPKLVCSMFGIFAFPFPVVCVGVNCKWVEMQPCLFLRANSL